MKNGLKKPQAAAYNFTPFFTAVYNQERLILQTIYVLNKKILQFLSVKSAVYNPEWFQIKNGLQWCLQGIEVSIQFS